MALHRKGLAGLGFKPQRFIDKAPLELLRVADELDLLVLEGGDLQDIAQALADLCQGRVTIVNQFNEEMAQAKPTGRAEAPQASAQRVRPVELKHRTIASIPSPALRHPPRGHRLLR